MRNVTPRDSAAVAKLLNAEDGLLRYVEGKFKALQAELFDLVMEVGKGYWASTVKELNRHEKLIDEDFKNLDALRDRVRKLEGKKYSGRGASDLAVPARLTLNTGRLPFREAA